MSQKVEKKTATGFSKKGLEKRDKKEDKTPIKYYKPLSVKKFKEGYFKIGECSYRLIYNHREGFDLEKFATRYSDVLSRYDYVVGDWGYEQLRLKGFFYTNNKNALSEQKINTLEDYLYEFCNFGCSFFVLERLGEAPMLSVKNGRYRKSRRKVNDYDDRLKSQAHIEEKHAELPKKKSIANQKWKEKLKEDLQKKTVVKKTESSK
jgi:uncharacterized protein YutD